MGLFTDWLNGPEDNSLEGIKKRLFEARKKAAPVKVTRVEPQSFENEAERKRKAAEEARKKRTGRGTELTTSGPNNPDIVQADQERSASIEDKKNRVVKGELPTKPDDKPSITPGDTNLRGGSGDPPKKPPTKPVALHPYFHH